MGDEKRVVATRMIETRLHLYDSFFDHDWARTEFARVPAQLTEAFEHLCLAWKEAANTHRLPWLMAQQMKAFADGVLKNHKPYLARFIEGVKTVILNGLSGALKRAERKTVEKFMKTIDQRLRLGDQQQREIAFPIDAYWNGIIEKSEFQLSIAGSQGQTYCGLVFAYEWFVVNCFRALGGDEQERPGWKKFWPEFKSLLGGEPKATYWDDREVRIAREVRNCIAHLGGKAKPELLAEKHDLFISPEGIISIQPLNNRALFDVLKQKVTQLIRELNSKLVSAISPASSVHAGCSASAAPSAPVVSSVRDSQPIR